MDEDEVDHSEAVQQGAGISFDDHVVITEEGSRHSRKFRVDFERYKVKVNGLQDRDQLTSFSLIPGILQHLLDNVVSKYHDQDRVRICLEAGCLSYPIWTPPTAKNQLTVERLMLEVNSAKRFTHFFL